ncbi:MAG: Gfo/Idh/MocA family oxidoreductase [Armatimonadetes bacterium]|nr:Gfo/Idh/MocA family oxidoreductase [Armatimonadota bacterium]
MSERPRAVVLGASGIGKHHVKWLLRAGCDVVGFLGTSPESLLKTHAMLKETLGFTGAGYTSLSMMLAECRPHLASVASPMHIHYEHVMACLGVGAHVLCEKPLVGLGSVSTDDELFLAQRLVSAAERSGVLLAVNTQYAAAAPHLRNIAHATGPMTEFCMQMESRGQNRTGGYEQIWDDLAAHPISVLLALVPDGEVDWSTVKCTLAENRNECAFEVAAPGGVCQARIVLGTVREGPLTRKFSVNGVEVGYEGRNDEHGVYCSYLTHGEQTLKATDFMEESITRFAAAARGEGRPLVTGPVGLKNLELQLRLLQGAERR